LNRLPDLRIGFARLVAVIDEVLFEVPELPLAGRVIHQGDQVHREDRYEVLHRLDDIRRRHLAAQMSEMLTAEESMPTRFVESLGQRDEFGSEAAAIHIDAGTKRIENSRDAG
jgi:hypothetical protein